jgi:hypothetical protein
MMTLKRLKALSNSYGADLLRWPAEVRRDAEALLRISDEARQILATAAETDAMLDAMSRVEQAVLSSGPEEAAALARLRAGVAARIAEESLAKKQRRRWQGIASLNGGVATLQANLGWLCLATSGAVAVVGGLFIGVISTPSSMPDAVLSLLQTFPLHVFSL